MKMKLTKLKFTIHTHIQIVEQETVHGLSDSSDEKLQRKSALSLK